MRAWLLLLKWQYLRWRRELIFIVVIQLALAVGIIYGLALLIPEIDPVSAMYLATGAPTVSLLVMGFNIVPQEVSNGKLTGRFDYLSSLPIPRLATLAADVAFWLVAQLPGTILALVIASIRFDFDLKVSWTVLPAVAFVSLTAACVGYGFALALRPEVANQLTSFIAIGVLLFSPINFPPDRLPDVLRWVHTVLPIQYMADVIRHGLVGRSSAPVAAAFGVVAAWCAAGLGLSYRIATRRA